MNHLTRQEVLARWRRRYARAGRRYKAQLLDQAIELFGSHHQAAIRVLRTTPASARAPSARGRPRTYRPDKLLPPLKAIWPAALQPCSLRLHACLPDWLPDYEADQRRLDPNVRQALLSASRATLDRLLQPLRGLDSDHGGEFITPPLQRYCATQQPKIPFPRSRAGQKNDQAHIEQKNFTQVRPWFGYARDEAPEVWPRADALCRGPLHQLLNYCLPTLKLEGKQRVGSKVVRQDGPAQTPPARALACAKVSEATKARLRAERAGLNALAWRREVDRRLREIEPVRQGTQT